MVLCRHDRSRKDIFKTRLLICLRAMPYKGREEKGDKSGHCVCLGPRIPPLRRSTPPHLTVRLSNNLFALHAIKLNIDISTSVNNVQALPFAFENESHMYETGLRFS